MRTLSRRFPISEEASSDCCRLRILSADSTGRAKSGDSGLLERSVGGVDDLDIVDAEELCTLGEDWPGTCMTTGGERAGVDEL